jgi:hypothetical protein
MPLPKITQPIYEFEIPSTGKKVNIRPFLVKEEKILFTAQQSRSRKEIARAIKQVINNCVVDKDFDVNKLTVTDFEYIFVQLRGVSVNNVIELQFIDNEDEQPYKFSVNVSDIKIIKPKKKTSNDIKVSDKIGITLDFPNIEAIEEFTDGMNEYEIIVLYLKNCIKTIYDEEEVYDPKAYSKEELAEFIESFSPKIFDKIKTFFNSMPKMEHTLQYTNSLGNDKKIVLSTLEDFFTLL